MRFIIVGVIVGVILIGSGCSAVPGDAAFRAGHPEQAAALYYRGAQQGDASAALRLGLLIDNGQVSPAEYGEAGEWFERSCGIGNITACHNAGVAYEYGSSGLPEDLALAHEFYFKAANSGYMQSQYNLASMYSNNHISPQDSVEGLKWMLLARTAAEQCRQQDLCMWILEDSPGHTQRLKSRLSDIQQSHATKLAAQWKPGVEAFGKVP